MPRRWKKSLVPVDWTPDLAYAVGLTATDGCLYRDGRHLAFDSSDWDLIHIYLRCIGRAVRPRIKRGEGECYQVQFSHVRLWLWLSSIGLSPAKSLTLGALQVPDDFFFDVA